MQLFVFGPVSLAFQKISLGLRSFVFHYWWDGLFVPAATWSFPWFFVGFALTAVGSIVLVDNVMEYLFIRSLNRTNAFLHYGSAQPIW
nr:MAG TPA: hypothetical protein [Caudoviricetes sp.]